MIYRAAYKAPGCVQVEQDKAFHTASEETVFDMRVPGGMYTVLLLVIQYVLDLPERERLEDILFLYLLPAVEVRYGSCHPQDLVVAAGREFVLLDRGIDKLLHLSRKSAVPLHKLCVHLAVQDSSVLSEPSFLYFPCAYDAAPHG